MLGYKKKRKSRRSARGTCRTGTVRFKTKRGKVVSFHGKSGPGCGPRKKPKTTHLKTYQRLLTQASKSCKGLKENQFKSCVASAMHGGKARRRRR